MKNVFVLLLSLFLLAACSTPETVTVRGKVKTGGSKDVALFKTGNGALQQINQVDVAADSSYSFVFKPEAPGFYAVGVRYDLAGWTGYMKHIFYAEAGDEVNMDLHSRKIAELTGKNTQENKALYQWEYFVKGIRTKVNGFGTDSDYKDFFPDLEEFVKKLPDFRKKLKSGNKEFDALLQRKIDYDVDYYAIRFLNTPRSCHPTNEDLSPWYWTIMSPDKFVTEDVLQHPLGLRVLDQYSNWGVRQSKQEYSVERQVSFIPNARLKGEFILDFLNSYRNDDYETYTEALAEYGKYLVTPSQKQSAEAVVAKLKKWAKGSPAMDFTYPDIQGKNISLSDFKGKVVLVDVWATWCSPCKAEMPHLVKLEKEMKGKDVVFIGVSMDKASDREKWAEFVKKEDLEGIQLFADGGGKITGDYKINGIPRFMVFDKQGNIVTIRAPRPSDPELKALLESLL